MIRAVLAGQKTVTRRVVKFPPAMAARGIRHDLICYTPGGPRWREYEAQLAAKDPEAWGFDAWPPGLCVSCDDQTCQHLPCPYGAAGDVLWARETWQTETDPSDRDVSKVRYRADGEVTCEGDRWTWRPSIFMPRWASRLTLAVTSVRVERLHAITPDEVLREGVRLTTDMGGTVMTRMSGKHPPTSFIPRGGAMTTDALLVAEFASLWSGINGRESWERNDYVWVVEFERVL